MVWWPFATQPERADTSEVTDLHSGAPPLYSVILRWRGAPIRISLNLLEIFGSAGETER
jgi:hypothetical protein